MKIVLVVGLPASGKTYYARARIARNQQAGKPSALLDDPRTEGDLQAFLRQAGEQGLHEVLITDPLLCDSHARESALRKLSGNLLEWVFF